MRQLSVDTTIARIARWGVLATILVGIATRLRGIARQALWLDEAYSRFAAERSWWFLWHIVPRYETHPPFYYSLLHLWRMAAGDSLIAYRLPGLLCGFATIAVAGYAAGALADRVGAMRPARTTMVCFAIGYVALCPMLAEMSREARPYAAMVLAYAVATLALLRLAGDAAERRPLSRGWLATFFVTQALILWLHALGPLFGVAMTLALALCVVRRGLPRADWAWLAAGQIAVALLYLPALLILAVEMPTWVRSTWLVFDPRTVPDELIQLYAGAWRPLGIYAGIAFVGGMMQFVRRRPAHRIAAALLVLAILPVLLSLLLSWTVSPVFLPRTLSPAAFPFALGIAMLALTERPRLAAPVFVALLLALSASYDLDREVWRPTEDWATAAGWIAPRVTPGDVVWAYPNEAALPLGYALEDRGRTLPIRQIPADVPALGYAGVHPTGTAGVVALRPADVGRLAADPATARPRAIWLVGLAAERIDPRDALLHALLATRTIGRSFKDNEIGILELVARPPAAMPGRAAPADAAATH